MAWTSPMTAVAGTTWSSANWNTHVRDNMLETMPALATAANRIYTATGLFDLAERDPASNTVAAAETRALTTYGALTTPGPAVTVTTGTKALCFYQSKMSNNTANAWSAMSIAVSGATTISANDQWAAVVDGVSASRANRLGSFHLFNTLTAGSNTFTAQYRVGSGTCTYSNRNLVVIPL